jgi:ribosomal protein L6P/L9E
MWAFPGVLQTKSDFFSSKKMYSVSTIELPMNILKVQGAKDLYVWESSQNDPKSKKKRKFVGSFFSCLKNSIAGISELWVRVIFEIVFF